MKDRFLTGLGLYRMICLSTTIFIIAAAQEFFTDDDGITHYFLSLFCNLVIKKMLFRNSLGSKENLNLYAKKN